MTQAVRAFAAAMTLGACVSFGCLTQSCCTSQSDPGSQTPAAQTDAKPKQISAIVIEYCDS